MKFLLTALLGFLPLVFAAQSLKSVIITFPDGTPSGVISQAKDSLVAAVRWSSHVLSCIDVLTRGLQGGVITHEYRKSQFLVDLSSRLTLSSL